MAGNKTILLILLLYIILVEYALDVSAVYFRQLHTARMVGKWPWNGPDWAMQARSKIQCGSFCSQRSECNVAVWKPDSGDCNMYKSLNLHFESIQAGATTETILIANALLGKCFICIIPRHPIRLPWNPRTIFHVCKIVHWDPPPPLNTKQSCPQKVWYVLCENAWFPWQPKADLRMGLYQQKYSDLCYNLS